MSKLRPTKYSNLMRDEVSGNYFARVNVGGKKKTRSLSTDNLATARRKLPATLDRLQSDAKPRTVQASIFELAAQYVRESTVNPNLAPRTKDFHKEIAEIFRRNWAGPGDVSRITHHDCLTFLSRMVDRYAPNRTNALQSLLVWAGKRAHREGLIADRHAFDDLPRRTARPKKLKLPDPSEFARIMTALRARWAQYHGWTYFAVQVIAHTGVRQVELSRLTWEDIDEAREETTIRTAKVRAGEDRVRVVPWIGEFGKVLEEIRQFTAAMEIEDARVIPMNHLNASFRRAFADIGTNLTPHDFRHLFATRAIESGVDIQTVSRWLGHSDGGALAMKFYGHLTDSHSKQMARKVRL